MDMRSPLVAVVVLALVEKEYTTATVQNIKSLESRASKDLPG